MHPIIAALFIPNPNNKPQINHIDGNKKNNHVSNLEWVTAKENQQHALATGLRKRLPIKYKNSKHSPLRKPIAQYDLNGNLLSVWDSVYDAALFYGKRPNSYTPPRHNATVTCCGFMWRRLDNGVAKECIERYHNKKWRNSEKQGIYITSKIPINQYNVNGDLIKAWDSLSDVSRHFGCSRWKIKSRLDGYYNNEAFGFIWKYALSDI